jgi:hypothetical protein
LVIDGYTNVSAACKIISSVSSLAVLSQQYDGNGRPVDLDPITADRLGGTIACAP